MANPKAVDQANNSIKAPSSSSDSSSERKDPVAAALRAVDQAEAAYKTASYRRNVLEFKARQQKDLQAKAELPKAQEEVEELQTKLKEAQSALARATGSDDPHARRKAPDRSPVARNRGRSPARPSRQIVAQARDATPPRVQTLREPLRLLSLQELVRKGSSHHGGNGGPGRNGESIRQTIFVQIKVMPLKWKVTPLLQKLPSRVVEVL